MILVIDLSDNNPTPWDFKAVAAAGYDGVILKLTEGVGYRNELFDQYWPQIKAAGLVRGCYHFARSASNSAESEADHFLRSMPVLEVGDIVVLDMEDPNAYGNRALWPQQAEWAWVFLNKVSAAIGFGCWIYSFPAFIKDCLQDNRLKVFHLWLADLNFPALTSLAPWDEITMSQYTWTGRVAGISGDVDTSRFYGTPDTLRLLGKPKPHQTSKYPYTTHTVARADMKAAASHASADAIDEKHRPVIVEQGAEVIVTGDDKNTDAAWRPVHLPPPSLVHGWMLPKFLEPEP